MVTTNQVSHLVEDMGFNVDGYNKHLKYIQMGVCQGLNVCVIPKSTCWSPNPQCDLRVSRRWGLWEVISTWGWNPMNGINALTRMEVVSPPCEDTAGRRPSANLEESPHQEPSPPAP